MGKHLGSLGTVRPARDDTFDYFGHTVRVHPQISDLQLIEFMRQAGGIDEADVVAGLEAVEKFLHSIVHEEDFGTFWQAALDNGQQTPDLMQVMFDIVTGLTGRPSARRSGSSTGRRKTGAVSTGGSSSEVIRRLNKRGRPDLAQAVRMAHEGRSRVSA